MAQPVPKTPRHHRAAHHGWLFWIILAVLILSGIASWGAWYAHIYAGRIYPGVAIGALAVGGKTHDEAFLALNERIDDLLHEGFNLMLGGERATIYPLVISPDDPDLSRELVRFDRTNAVKQALAVGRGQNPLLNLWEQLSVRLTPKTIVIPVTIAFPELQTLIEDAFAASITPAKDAALTIEWEDSTPRITITPEKSGTNFDSRTAEQIITRALKELRTPAVALDIVSEAPSTTASDVAAAIPQTTELLATGPWTLTFEQRAWHLTPQALSPLLAAAKDAQGNPLLTVGGPALDNFLNEIASAVDRQARDAKFKLEGNRVVEFQSSRGGITLDKTRTAERMQQVFIKEGGSAATIKTVTTEPVVTTAEVNNLGIETLLGVGISNFRGSPPNRIKNIKNGARLANGTLVLPGENFSLLKTLAPFTIENGYLPELVIKGDKIKPEIGGGLCQLGTTTFRATMNSGLPVTARRNHSLVVSYYNDPANGNPGTDATIYDPAPDFQFLNDTGAHILITTEVDEPNKELRFLFWGKPDGRKGYYSPPVVTRWIPEGEPRTIETTDLEPGAEQCQSGHMGADAHFTYTIERSNDAVEEKVFESHYRPLPKICLLGVVAPSEEAVPPPDPTQMRSDALEPSGF